MFDVCIAGGGPAGAALARRLGQFGRRVAIVERAPFPRRHIGESLTSGLNPLLDTLGVRELIEAGGLLASEWATVDWGGECRRTRIHGGGMQVDRARFDRILLDAARAAGDVCVYQPARIVESYFEDGAWDMRLDGGTSFRARYFADAAGRARVLGGTKTRIGAPTLALYAWWSGADCPDADTLVEAGSHAWYWGAPIPTGEFNATVFVDPGSCGAAQYVELVRKSRLIGPRLRHAQVSSEIYVCDATPYLQDSPVSAGSIHAGDAALSIDPLSSQGVQTAIGTSLHAAVVLNTMLESPGDTALAMEFYCMRLEESARFHSAAAAGFYRAQYGVRETPFWKRRAALAEATSTASETAGPLRSDTLVRVAPSVEFARVPAVQGSRVVAEEGVRHHGKTFVYIGNARRVALLLREIEPPTPAAEVLHRWSRSMAQEEALDILRWAWNEGLLV